ncbi:MFS transporter [Nocardiopsis oceani]
MAQSTTTDPHPPPPASGPRGMRRVIPMVGLGALGFNAFYIGIGSVLLPLHVQGLFPGNEEAAVANLGLVSGVAAVFGVVFNPLGGALSDRTRTRWGRRNPWILGAAVVSLALVLVMGLADSLLMVALGWCLAQGAMNFHQAAVTAVVPDRVPEDRRGSAAAALGIAVAAGGILGTALATALSSNLTFGYVALGGLVVAVAVLLTSLTHDPRGDELPPPPPRREGPANPLRSLGRFLSALSHRNFLLVLVSRAVMYLGYFIISSFTLYILDYHVELPASLVPAQGVTLVVLLMASSMIVASIVLGPLSDRLDRRRQFAIASGVLASLSMLIPFAVPTWTGMLVFAVAMGLSFGSFVAVDTALATLVLPNKGDAARDMGVFNIAAAGPQVIAPFIASLIILHLGGYGSLFLVGSVLGLVGALTICFVRGIR